MTGQWLRFPPGACPGSSATRFAELDRAFRFTVSGTQEALIQWLERCVRDGCKPVHPRLAQFVLEVGRRKYLKPRYAALAVLPRTLAFERGVYASARPGYRAALVGTVDKPVGWL